MTIPLKSFIFLRHGETDWNRQHIVMGQTDIPLNEKGLMQASLAAKLLKNISFTSIAVNPLMRAIQTAQIISKSTSTTIIENLKECSWGIMEGQPKGDGSWVHNWRNDFPIKNAELFSIFTKRVIAGLNQALKLPGPVLIIAHGGVYWAIQQALQLPFIDLANCTPVYHQPPERRNHPWLIYNLDNEEYL